MTIRKKPAEKFIRMVGINKVAFKILTGKIEKVLEQEKEKKPIIKRGKKSSIIIEDQLLLCLIYLRRYPTFLDLGDDFGISEGYANKVYHKISKLLILILQLPSREALTYKGLKAVVVDASEQPIERPKRKQKEYYSGKKNDIQ